MARIFVIHQDIADELFTAHVAAVSPIALDELVDSHAAHMALAA